MSGATHCGLVRWSRKGSFTKRLSSRRERTGRISTLDTGTGTYTSSMSETAKAPVAVFEKARSHERLEQLEAAKQHDLLPYFRLIESEAGPILEGEGHEGVMPRPNNYLGLTRAERVKQRARETLENYGNATTGSPLIDG